MNEFLPGVRICLLPVLLLLSSPSFAAGPADGARFALHATDVYVPAKGVVSPCYGSPNDLDLSCFGFNVHRPTPGPTTVYLVLGDLGGAGVDGASCGVDYAGGPGEGIDPHWVRWNGCTDGLEFPNGPEGGDIWPGPGGGLRVTWSTCQYEAVNGIPQATVGSFYVYA